MLFVSAPGNPPQFVCYRQCNLPAGAHRQQLAHRGRWSCRVKLVHELLQLIMWDRGRVWQHADRTLYMHCGPVSFAAPVHCHSHNDNTYCTSFIHSSPISLNSHRTLKCRYVTDYRDEKLADEFIVGNRKRLQTVCLKYYVRHVNWQGVGMYYLYISSSFHMVSIFPAWMKVLWRVYPTSCGCHLEK